MAAGEGVPSEAVAAQGAENPSGERVFFGGLSGLSGADAAMPIAMADAPTPSCPSRFLPKASSSLPPCLRTRVW